MNFIKTDCMGMETAELYFLIARFLSKGPCKDAANTLQSEILHNPQLLPARYNWKGQKRPYSNEELTTLFENIDTEHLPRLLSRLIDHADAQIPPIVPGIRSLLATGGSSLLRTRAETEKLQMIQGNVGAHTIQRTVFSPKRCLSGVKILNCLRTRDIRGLPIRGSRMLRCTPSPFNELVVMNGHRFPTYCVLFDRTNNRIITGSDDYLIKIWSAQSGYLLFTLRGHSAVVSYMDISSDNKMLATASHDGIVRVWDVKSSAPIAVLLTGTLRSSGNRKHLTTVSFSPSPIPQIRYLIATSLDGFTWVWKYDRDTNKFQTPPTMLDCKTFHDSTLKCSTWNLTGSQFAVAGADLFIRVFSTIQGGPEAIKNGKRRKSYDKSKAATEGGAEGSSNSNSTAGMSKQNWGDPVLIAHLEGHSGVVTSLSYSRHGNRLLSGSVDGSVRIWKYDQQSKMWTSLAIDVRDEHTQADATITAAKHMLPSPTSASGSGLPNPFLTGLSSTSAAAENITSNEGNNPDSEMNEVTSSQADGANQPNTVEAVETTRRLPQESGIIPTMAIWSLDDSSVILTTSLGEIKIFDSVTGRLVHTLKGHVKGSPIYVVDVHPFDNDILMTAGYDGQVILWDVAKGIQVKTWTYPEIEFLDGRFSPNGLMFTVTDQEGKCILFGAGMNLDDYKDARSFSEQTFWSDYAPVRYDADHNVVDDATQIAPHLMERTPILDNNGRDYAKQKGPRFGLDLPVVLPPGTLEQEESLKKDLLERELENLAEQTLTILPTTDKKSLYKRRKDFILEEDDDDDDPMTTEVPIVPLPNDSSGEEYAGEAASPSSSSSDSESDDSDLAEDDAGAIPASQFVVNDDDDDDDYAMGSQGSKKRRATSSGGMPRRQKATTEKKRRGRRARKKMRLQDSGEDDDDLDIDGFDYSGESEDYEAPGSSSRGRRSQGNGNGMPSGSKSQRSARPKSFANDDYPSDEALESSSNDDDDDEGIASESSISRSFSGMTNSDMSMPASPKKKQWRGNGRKKGKAVVRDEELQRWLPSEWIKANEPQKSPYRPQIGDYVAYFRQGHSLYVKETPLRSKLNLKVVPYIKDPSLPWVIFGRVSRITYNVGPPTWCTITLEEQILSSEWGFPPNPEFTASRRRFEVEFHDLGEVPDFVVLYNIFQEGMNVRYCVGEEIWVTFDESTYCGTITAQVLEDQSLPESSWMAYEVSWPDNDDVTNLSPWEMQHQAQDDDLSQLETIPPQEYSRIEEIIEHLLQMDEFQIFKSQVDFEAYPDYCKAIAYPICLESIQERLGNHYYRRSRAVQFDIEILENNALTYNDPKSNIAMYAKHIARIFKTSVANHSKPLPSHVHVKNSRKDEDDEFDGSGSENELVDIESEPEPEFDDDLLVDEEDDSAFLDDEESSNDESRTSSRSRNSQRRSASNRASRSTRKIGTSGPSRKKQNGHGSGSSAGAGRVRGRRGRPRKVEENRNEDEDDGEWGKPRTNGTRRGRRSHANAVENDSDEADYAQPEESDEDNYGMDEFKESASSRSSRNKRKKTRIVDSDSDFV